MTRIFHTIFTFGLLLIFTLLNTLGCVYGSKPASSLSEDRSINAATPRAVVKVEETPRKTWNTFRNTVDGIAIGSTYDELVAKFGKPDSMKKGGENPCGGKKTVVRYKGIVFHMDKAEVDSNIVVLIEITSPKWVIAPGISTGFTESQVRAKMGADGEKLTVNGSEKLVYCDGDGWLEFHFADGKLAKIWRNLNQC